MCGYNCALLANWTGNHNDSLLLHTQKHLPNGIRSKMVLTFENQRSKIPHRTFGKSSSTKMTAAAAASQIEVGAAAADPKTAGKAKMSTVLGSSLGRRPPSSNYGLIAAYSDESPTDDADSRRRRQKKRSSLLRLPLITQTLET